MALLLAFALIYGATVSPADNCPRAVPIIKFSLPPPCESRCNGMRLTPLTNNQASVVEAPLVIDRAKVKRCGPDCGAVNTPLAHSTQRQTCPISKRYTHQSDRSQIHSGWKKSRQSQGHNQVCMGPSRLLSVPDYLVFL